MEKCSLWQEFRQWLGWLACFMAVEQASEQVQSGLLHGGNWLTAMAIVCAVEARSGQQRPPKPTKVTILKAFVHHIRSAQPMITPGSER